MATRPVSDETIPFKGKMLEIVQRDFETDGRRKTFEWARRAPGTRLILDDKQAGKILLTREYRTELEAYDYRLPGGKVFDTLAEYNTALANQTDMLAQAVLGVCKEGREETGYDPKNPQLIKVSKCGATVEWDLYYFVADAWTQMDGQDLESGEDIATAWFAYDDVKAFCVQDQVSEDRSRAVLLAYLLGKQA